MFGFFIPLIAVEIYSQLDKIMLGSMTIGALENGYYEQARKNHCDGCQHCYLA